MRREPLNRDRSAARLGARGTRDRSPPYVVEDRHFDAREWETLGAAALKLTQQRRPVGLRDLSVLTPTEMLAVKKFVVLGTFGVWHPEFGPMSEAELRAHFQSVGLDDP